MLAGCKRPAAAATPIWAAHPSATARRLAAATTAPLRPRVAAASAARRAHVVPQPLPPALPTWCRIILRRRRAKVVTETAHPRGV